jgi:hypothetical protein
MLNFIPMPLLKTCFAKLKGFDPSEVQAVSTRLNKITFGLNLDMQVIGTDRTATQLNIEVATRRKREVDEFNDAKGTLTREERYEYKRHLFNADAGSGVAATPGAKRDFKLLTELLHRAGAAGAESENLIVDLQAWTQGLLKMYESAQLAQLVLENFCAEPKLIGRYTARTVDNRLDPKLLESPGGSLKAIRLSFFHDGVRRTVEARNDAVLTVTSADEDDLEHFASEQRQLLLKHSSKGE